MTVELANLSSILDYSSSLSVILITFLLCLILMFTVWDTHVVTTLGRNHRFEAKARFMEEDE